ncbi:class I SAM-dependent methyltransferase [Dehalococcoidia bacterium]|nr:class I SAM-dependent methyltransferase [Dehalococcoidia bacterium]
MREKYFEVLVKELKIKLHPSLVLDIGCANGLFIRAFLRMGVSCYGIDLFPSGDGTIKGDARFFPFKDNSFDLITATEVLEHVEEYEDVISEINRVLKPGGFVFMTTPTPIDQLIRKLIGSASDEHVVLKFGSFWINEYHF